MLERQQPPPALAAARPLRDLLDEVLLRELAQVVARRAGRLAKCAGDASGVRLPVLGDVVEDPPPDRVGQRLVQLGALRAGAWHGLAC